LYIISRKFVHWLLKKNVHRYNYDFHLYIYIFELFYLYIYTFIYLKDFPQKSNKSKKLNFLQTKETKKNFSSNNSLYKYDNFSYVIDIRIKF